MRKFKYIVPFLLALIMALAIPFAACGKKKGENVTTTLHSIEVDASGAKTLYVVGDAFTADGIVVKAYFAKSNSDELEEKTLSEEDYELDSTAFKKDVAGKYSIKVSYTYDEDETKEDSYDVRVVDPKDGLVVTLADGVADTYDLSKANPKVDIDVSKIVVKDTNRDGTTGNVVAGYSVKLYKGQEEVALTDNKASVGGGAYTIWVEKESDKTPGYMRSAFTIIYVNDDIDTIVVNKSVGTYSQPEGVDLISKTWEFTVNYVSGATKTITTADCNLTVDTMKAGQKTAKASYTERNAKGGVISKEFDVPYEITAFTGKKNTHTYNYGAIDSEGKKDKDVLTQADFKGANSFLTLGDGEVTYRTSPALIEVKGAGLKITIEGTGMITVGLSSTGGSNQSRVGLIDEEGNYIAALYDKTNANIGLDDSEDEDGNPYNNVYLVTGTSASEFKFVIAKAGTYTIVSEPNSAYNRGCRLHSITVLDYVPDSAGAALSTVDFSNQTYITDKKVEMV